jgi:hypothetical protein
MAYQEVLIMAMTCMRGGICTAGLIRRPHPSSHFQWVRPVKRFGLLLLGDMTTADGHIVQVGDVIQLSLVQPCPDPPHVEDWLTDFVKQRPRCVRPISREKWGDLLARYCDKRPAEVLCEHTRSLCLVHPQDVWANFFCDAYSGKYQARIGFNLPDLHHAGSGSLRGLPVTDIRWRALGRHWLAQDHSQEVSLDQACLQERLQAEAIYLSIGLSRRFQGQSWPLVIGVYPVPDYTVTVDYRRL